MRQRQASDTPDHYADLHSRFGWQVPEHFNMAVVCSRRWAANPATAQQTAVIACAPGQPDRRHSYAELQQQANRLSNALEVLGVQRGDRVAIVMPQRFETAVAYMAVLQMGAVGMPLSQLFGPEALEFRLQDSEAVVAICDASTLAAVQSVGGNCPLLRSVVAVDGQGGGATALDWAKVLAQADTGFDVVHTRADEAAVLIYTSGTTGNPKGALIPHRALIGNLTGFVCSQNWFGFDPFDASQPSQAVFWSPADWAWTGGLMDALLPSLYFGRHRGLQWPLQPADRVRADGTARRDPHLPVPDRAQGHDEGLPPAAKAVPVPAAGHHERGRSRGRRGVRLLPAATGRDGQRNVWPDRDQLHRGQLRHAMGRRSAGPPQARRHPHGGQRPAQRRSAGANRLASEAGQHGQRLPGPPRRGDRR
jgi:hypothetical protein